MLWQLYILLFFKFFIFIYLFILLQNVLCLVILSCLSLVRKILGGAQINLYVDIVTIGAANPSHRATKIMATFCVINTFYCEIRQESFKEGLPDL